MKKVGLVLLFGISLFACKSKKGIPDVSAIKVDINLERFDKDFFAIDSTDILPGLNQLHQKYPLLTNIFLRNILGLDSAATLPGVRRFLTLNRSIWNSADEVFKNTEGLEKDFQKAFRYIKYYFPEYKVPKIITVVGPIDALAQGNNVYTPDFSLYKETFFIENVAPEYRSRRFSKEYITADAMQLIVDDLFQDKSSNLPLIEQIIEKGKQWYLLDKFLPDSPDSIKTGYTQDQLDWCHENEGLIWSYLVKNEDLNSLNPAVIQTYIGEGPFTQGFSQEFSPGNIGQWIGWQIIKKFESKNPGMNPGEVMNTDARKILEEAKYKPK